MISAIAFSTRLSARRSSASYSPIEASTFAGAPRAAAISASASRSSARTRRIGLSASAIWPPSSASACASVASAAAAFAASTRARASRSASPTRPAAVLAVSSRRAIWSRSAIAAASAPRWPATSTAGDPCRLRRLPLQPLKLRRRPRVLRLPWTVPELARGRHDLRAQAGPAAAGLSAPFWPRAGAGRPRSDTRWQSRTPALAAATSGEVCFSNPWKASSGGR